MNNITDYEKDFAVSSAVCDADGICNLPFLLSCMERIAKEDAIRLGQGSNILAERYNAAWMILRTDMQVLLPIRAGMFLHAVTWTRGIKGAAVLRDFLFCFDDNVAVRATQVWIVADLSTRRLRNPRTIPELDTPCPKQALTNAVLHFHLPEMKHVEAELTVTEADIDENGHMNNARYLCHASPYLPHGLSSPCHIQIEYSAELLCGQTFQCLTAHADQTFFLVFRTEQKNHFMLCMQPLPD